MVNPDAVRGQVLLEESREAVVVLDAGGIVVTASRRARQSLGVREGEELSPELLENERDARRPVRRRRPAGAARLSLRGGRPRRLRGAALRLHRGGLARAADAARAAALAARAGRAAGRGRPRPRRAGARRGRPDPRADRRGALPGRARVGHARRLARRRAGPAGAARGRGRARGAGGARRRRAARGGRGRTRPPRCARGCSASSPRTWPRTRSATPGRARTRRSPSAREDGSTVLSVVDDGAGVDAGRPAAPVRALLPRRPLAAHARHGPRARDREARRRLGGRYGRGARRARQRPRDPLRVPHPVVTRSPPFHRIFTSRQPRAARDGSETRRMTNKRETIDENCAPARPARSARRLRRRPRRRRRGGRDDGGCRHRRRRPLRPDPGGRLEHGRPAHDGGGRELPGRAARTSRSPSASPAPAAASSASAAARPTSRRLAADQGRGGDDLQGRTASTTSSSRSRTTRSRSS